MDPFDRRSMLMGAGLAGLAAVVATAIAYFGHLDILVNNAGRGMRLVSDNFLIAPTRFWEVAAATWRDIIDTNVTGPFLMARACAPAGKP